MPKVNIPPVTPVPDNASPELKTVNRSIMTAIERIVAQINASGPSKSATDLDMAGYRITNLSEPANGRDAVNRDYLEKRLSGLTVGSVTHITNISGGTPGTGSNTLLEVTLTADTTITASAPAGDGDVLIVAISQDGTGGWTITWDSNFDADTLVDLDLRANSKTIYTFVGASGSWSQSSIPFLRN